MRVDRHHAVQGRPQPPDPGQDEAPAAGTVERFRDRQNQRDDFASDDKKRFATLRARAALAGFTLEAIEAEAGTRVFIVSRWSLTRELRDLAAVERFLVSARA
jgi:hypothetical protein